jgi:serine/threonine-protein kinase RsbW
MSCDEDLVLIRIKDMGAGFDPNKLPDPRDDDRLEIPGGRGVMLIHELMGEVTYNEVGNEVTMRKRRGDDPEIPEESDDQDE